MNKQVAIVTGGTRGIGLAIIRHLLSKGIHVATVSRSGGFDGLETEAAAHEATLMGRQCDVTDFGALESFAKDVITRHGRVDYLVNNVGIDVFKSVFDVPFSEWKRSQDVILNAPFVLSKAVLPIMRQQRFGRILMLGASSRDYDKGAPGLAPFGVHKAALKALMRSLALEEIAHGITVNMVSPGSTLGAGSLPEEQRIPVERIPIGRRIQLQELLAAIDYFLGEHSAATTGQVIGVNGGMST